LPCEQRAVDTRQQVSGRRDLVSIFAIDRLAFDEPEHRHDVAVPREGCMAANGDRRDGLRNKGCRLNGHGVTPRDFRWFAPRSAHVDDEPLRLARGRPDLGLTSAREPRLEFQALTHPHGRRRRELLHPPMMACSHRTADSPHFMATGPD
jgi:hypothetical protein